VSNLGWPDQQVYHGAEGAMQFNAEWAAAWDDWEMVPEDYIDAGERVVVILIQRGRSKATGFPSRCASLKCGRSRTGRGSGCTCTGAWLRRSKPWGCRSRTLTPAPEPAGYCAGDVAGER
jgi:hypothetical protein